MNTFFETDIDALAVATSADQADDSQQAVACTDPDDEMKADSGDAVPAHTGTNAETDSDTGDEIAAELNAEASVDAYALEPSDLPQLYQDNALTFYYSTGGIFRPSDREAAFVAYYRFIKAITQCKGVAFSVSAQGEITVKHSALAKLFDQVELINSYMPSRTTNALSCAELEHAYGVYQRLAERRIWRDVCNPELPPKAYNVSAALYQRYETARQAWQVQRVRAFNSIIRKIRASFNTVAYEHSQSKQQYEHKRQLQRYQDYVRDLMVPVKSTGRRRLLVVRLDLGMQKATLKKYDLTAFLEHLEALFWHTERQEVFKHLEGYIRKVEFGAEKGWHAHLILLFDYDVVQSGYTKAERVGQYWQQVVQQRCAQDCGVYFNCHLNQKLYKFNGIGKLDNGAEDYPDKLHNLLEHVVPYLLKNDYAVRFTEMPKQKLLNRGQLSQASQAAVQQAAATQHQLTLQSGVLPEVQLQPQSQSQSHMQQPQEVKYQPQDMVQQTAQKAAKPKLSPLERAEAMLGEKLTIRPHRSRSYVSNKWKKRR